MKILHTSDWHLGHSLYNHDRTEEQASMLEQMADLVHKEKPDAFLLSGDVFHTDQPSAAVQRMLADALVAIHNAHPAMTIVCTAGNHDSASRHEVFRLPWLSLNVHSIGQLSKDNPERHIISISGKGFVVAVPYCYERNIPEGFFQQLLDRVQELNTLHLPVIMMAHTTMENSDLKGHDFKRSFTTGGIETMSISQTGRGYDYLALGHIRKEKQGDVLWERACDCVVARFLLASKIGKPSAEFTALPPANAKTEDAFYQWLLEHPDEKVPNYFTMSSGQSCMRFDYVPTGQDWRQLFSEDLQWSIRRALRGAANAQEEATCTCRPAELAKAWFISSYPLLGAIATRFRLVTDVTALTRMGIRSAT